MTTGKSSQKHVSNRKRQQQVQRISISLPPKLLEQFDKSMEKAGFKDKRSKSISNSIFHLFNK